MTVGIAPPPAAFDIAADVVVVGAGACGLVAGLRALEAGADVVVLERDPRPMGSTSMSSGFIPAPGTRFQRAIGVSETPADFARDIQKKAGGGADPAIVETVTGQIGPALEWLADRHGLEWHVLDDFLYPGHSKHRMHAVPEKTGAGLMARLQAAAAAAGLVVVTDARVDTQHADGGRIAGVSLTRPDGASESIGCRAVILACNGYGGNPELVAENIPEIAGAPYFGHPGNTGDAVLWGRALGAATKDLGAYQGHGSLAHPHGILITWALMMEGGIQVNAEGRRFSNEHGGYSEQSVNVLAQPGSVAWNVYDDRLHRVGMGFPDYRDAVAAGAVLDGSDAQTIAERTGLPAEALQATLDQQAACCAGRAQDPFGRDFAGKPMLSGRLHAVKVTGALFHTQGGLVIDRSAHVLKPDGTVLPNLYAGGGAACGVSGARVSGYLSGNGLLTAVALGYVAGQTAAIQASLADP
ncbi:MAG TPA: FAD-dependent oxidoreductase [Thermohalobaculum sp.]|nr:FAD-dependent oxidoreductase [Thermohalobaculum sp.]